MTRDQLRSLELSCAVGDKLRESPETVLAKARANLARMQNVHTRGQGAKWLAMWAERLDGPVADVVDVLTTDSAVNQELRQNSPFAGWLSARERSRVLEDFNNRLPIGL